MGDDRINKDYRRETYQPRNTVDRGGRLIRPDRPEKSRFEKVLEETSQNSEASFNSNIDTAPTEIKDAVKAVASQQERFGKEKDTKNEFQKRLDEKESGKNESKSRHAGDSQAPRAKEAEKRVVGRESLSERGHHGSGRQGGHGEGGTGHGKQGNKGMSFTMSSKDMKGLQKGNTRGTSQKEFTLETTAGAQGQGPLGSKAIDPKVVANPLLKALPKALLDQLVQYCRLVTKTDGDKEMDMQLHESIFKGLRLRVSMVQGRVAATFITQSSEIKSYFEAHKSEIEKELSEKGIEVQSIHVIIQATSVA